MCAKRLLNILFVVVGLLFFELRSLECEIEVVSIEAENTSEDIAMGTQQQGCISCKRFLPWR